MLDDMLLKVRLKELKEDVLLVETLLDRAAEQRFGLTELSRLVRNGGDGSLGEPLIDALYRLMTLERTLGDDGGQALAELRSSLNTLDTRLRQAANSAALVGKRLGGLKIDDKVYEDIRHFLQYCTDMVEEIDDLLTLIRGDIDQGEAWRRFDTIAANCQPLFDDYVDFLAGVTLRDYELDNGIASLADLVFKELKAGWIAMPTRQGGLETKLRAMARFRFPEWTIWDVPLAGYHAGMSIVDTVGESVISKFRTNHPDTFVSDSFARQLFSEVYAARLVGPAYACAALVLHLHPRVDTFRTDEAPSAIDRAYVVLATLRNYGDTNAFSVNVERLADWWSFAAGGEDTVRPADAEVLDEFVARVVTGPLKPRSKLNRPYGPEQWGYATKNVIKASDVPSGPVLDRLNAAWHLRMTTPHEALNITATSESGGAPVGKPTGTQRRDAEQLLGNVPPSTERDHGQ